MGRFFVIVFLLLSFGLNAQVVVEELESRFSKLPDSSIVDTRPMDSAIIHQIESEEAYWYADYVPPTKNQTKSRPASIPWLKYVLIGLLIAAIIYFISGSKFSIFRRSNSDSFIEDYSSQKEEVNLHRELANAERKEDYRLAVRYRYLILLKELDLRGYIKYDKEKPNDAYLSALRNNSIYKPFFKLTRLFEQVFYGGFDLDKEGYALVSSQFKNIKL